MFLSLFSFFASISKHKIKINYDLGRYRLHTIFQDVKFVLFALLCLINVVFRIRFNPFVGIILDAKCQKKKKNSRFVENIFVF